MSTDFVADQVVTAEELANISIDLGATEYTDFSSLTPPLAVNELNKITMDLVSKGVLLTLNRCQVTCDGDVITVAEGVCVFENGAKIRLTEPKTISKMPSGVTYVYFLNNITESTAGLYASSAAPVEGDFVMLASVSEDGIVADMRTYATGKSVYARNQEYKITQEFRFNGTSASEKDPADPPYEYNYEIPFDGFNYVGIHRRGSENDSAENLYGIVKLEENIPVKLSARDMTGNDKLSGYTFEFKKNGKNINIKCSYAGSSTFWTRDFTILFI